MLRLDSTGFRDDILATVESLVKNQQQGQIDTKEGRAIILCEQEYRNIQETLLVASNPELSRKILEGMATPLEDCLSEDEVEW